MRKTLSRIVRNALLTTVCLVLARPLSGDSDTAVSGWKAPQGAPSLLVQAGPDFPGAVILTAPKNTGKTPVTYTWNYELPSQDWSAFERLTIPVSCGSKTGIFTLKFTVADHTQRKASFNFKVSPRETKVLILPIRKHITKAKADLKAIARLQLQVTATDHDLKLFLGKPDFLKPKQPVPQLTGGFKTLREQFLETSLGWKTATLGWKTATPHAQIDTHRTPEDFDQAVLFTAKQWDREHRALAMWEYTPDQRDWTDYDRLALPVFCDSKEGAFNLEIVIFDSFTQSWNTATWWISESFVSGTGKVLIVPIRERFKRKKTQVSNIDCFQFYVDNPRTDFRLYMGRIKLLKPGEPAPVLSQRWQDIIRKRTQNMVRDKHLAIVKRFKDVTLSDLKPELQRRFDSMRNHFIRKVNHGDYDLTLKYKGNADIPLQQVPQSYLDLLRKQPPKSRSDVMVGYAPPTFKVLPEAPVFLPLPQVLSLDAARNEAESLQLVVMPSEQGCQNLKVTLSDFVGPSGKLPANTVQAIPVGFVETTTVCRAGSSHIGAWPDPLLPFLTHVSVRPYEAQPFWLRARIPVNQAPGTYQGTITIWLGEENFCQLPLQVRVRNFTLPAHSMLPLAVSFRPHNKFAGKHWKKHIQQWHDMLTSYYLKFDHLYSYQAPEEYFPFWLDMQKQGTLDCFNLGNWEEYLKPRRLAMSADNMKPILENIRPAYQKAKELGLLKYAYLYGGDELRGDKFDKLEVMAKIVKKEFPGIPLLTTSYNNDLAHAASKSVIDGFCPLIHHYERDLVAVKALRKAGKKVWWYTCCEPLPPYPNSFIESRGAEIRLIMGAMTAKYRPDGFLFWQISIWLHPGTITKGPHTGWNGRSYNNFNGDGCWCYPGPDATPIATIRMENFRDGLEDYAYVKLLENALNKARKQHLKTEWCKQAEDAINVPENLVKDLAHYSVDFNTLQTWRRKLATLLEQAP